MPRSATRLRIWRSISAPDKQASAASWLEENSPFPRKRFKRPEKIHGLIDVRGIDLRTCEPSAQLNSAQLAVAIHGNDRGTVFHSVRRHPFERIGFDAEPIARIVCPGRILLQRENTIARFRPDRPGCCARRPPWRHATPARRRASWRYPSRDLQRSQWRSRKTISSMDGQSRIPHMARRQHFGLSENRIRRTSPETRDRQEPPPDRRQRYRTRARQCGSVFRNAST